MFVATGGTDAPPIVREEDVDVLVTAGGTVDETRAPRRDRDEPGAVHVGRSRGDRLLVRRERRLLRRGRALEGRAGKAGRPGEERDVVVDARRAARGRARPHLDPLLGPGGRRHVGHVRRAQQERPALVPEVRRRPPLRRHGAVRALVLQKVRRLDGPLHQVRPAERRPAAGDGLDGAGEGLPAQQRRRAASRREVVGERAEGGRLT